MKLTLDDAKDGDTVIIHGRNYRVMGYIGKGEHHGVLCRENGVGDAVMFTVWQPIESIAFSQPTRKSRRMEDETDPLMRRGDGPLLEWTDDEEKPETD